MENNKTFIYGLFAKDNPKEIRYVGKSDNPSSRIKSHIASVVYKVKKNEKLTYKDRWIVKNNYEIDIIVLEECDYDNWQEKEIEHITKYDNLTNTCSGGYGGQPTKYDITYEEAKEWVKNNIGAKSISDWLTKCRNNLIPDLIPKNPDAVFKNRGWISWGDFLSTGNKYDNDVDYVTYEEAKILIKDMNIKNSIEYRKLKRSGLISEKIPFRVERYYEKRGWVSWGNFLGHNIPANQLKTFTSFEVFKKILKYLGIKSSHQFSKVIKDIGKIYNIPHSPATIYKNEGWINWETTLEITDKTDFKNLLSFEVAREYVKKLNLKNSEEWDVYRKSGLKPNNIPHHPQNTYKDKGWISMGDFLGTGNICNSLKVFIPFEEAREIVRSHKLKNNKEWRKFFKINGKILNIPSNPKGSYKNEWIDWWDWLGNGNKKRGS